MGIHLKNYGHLLGATFVGLLLLTACTTQPDSKPADTPAEALPAVTLDIQRTELLLQGVGRAMGQHAQAGIRQETYATYEQHLKSEFAFFHEFLTNSDPKVSERQLAEGLVNFAADKTTQALIDSVLLRYSTTYDFAAELRTPLQRLKKEFPDLPTPRIRTYINGYQQPGQETMDPHFLARGFYGIGLHYYLGPQFAFYPPDIPRFVRARMLPQRIAYDMAASFADELMPPIDPRKRPGLLDYMVEGGIRLYFIQRLLPQLPDSSLLGYSTAQLQFAQINQARIYNELLPLLYEADYLKYKRWLADAPTTPGLAAEAPGRLAHYIGWRVVCTYMAKHPETTLRQLVAMTDYKKLFEAAGYRP